MVAICVRRANLSLMVQVVTVVRYATRDRSSLSNCNPPSYNRKVKNNVCGCVLRTRQHPFFRSICSTLCHNLFRGYVKTCCPKIGRRCRARRKHPLLQAFLNSLINYWRPFFTGVSVTWCTSSSLPPSGRAKLLTLLNEHLRTVFSISIAIRLVIRLVSVS